MNLKKIIRIPARIKKRITLSKIIQGFDKASDHQYQITQHSLDNGWLKTRIDDILEAPGISERMRNSELRRKPNQGKQIYYNWDIPEFVWDAILRSDSIINIAKSYIGSEVRLDDLYIKTIVDGLESGAEGWHDDNVGYRLKVFMVFDTEGTPSDTLLIPHSRPNLYNVKIKDEIKRMIGKPDKNHRSSEIRVNYKAGDCLVFDTNLVHRGDYTTNCGVRYCLVAEFIDRNKVNEIRDSCPCGPGQSARQIKIPKSSINILNDHPLIDKKILNESLDCFYYGYTDMKKSAIE
jgi:hypothetical protein